MCCIPYMSYSRRKLPSEGSNPGVSPAQDPFLGNTSSVSAGRDRRRETTLGMQSGQPYRLEFLAAT